MLAAANQGTGVEPSGRTTGQSWAPLQGVSPTNMGVVLGWGGPAVLIEELDSRALLFIEIHAGEHARRTASGIGALADLRTLATLWELPQGLETPKASLAADLRSRMGNMPGGVAESVGDAWIRLAAPPLRIQGALAWAAPWRRAAATLGAFVTLAPRVAVIPLSARASDQVLVEASFWGIGLVTSDSEPSLLLGPQPPEVEFGPYQWWLAECAYAAWLASG